MKELSFENILNQLIIQFVVYDSDFRYIYMNEEEESDLSIRKFLVGKTDLDYCKSKFLDSKIAENRLEYLQKSVNQRNTIQYEEEFEVNGKIKYYKRTITPNFDLDGKLINIIRQGSEITEIKKVISELEFTANHDSLTGLPNRRYLYFRLSEELNKNSRGEILIYLLDLDRFKTINDTLGHMIGDTLIKSVAQRITELFPGNSDILVSRLGGDEFVIVYFNSKPDLNQNLYAKNILKCFEKPFHLGEHELFITTSIGVYGHSSQEKNSDIDSIIKYADIAMYKAKEAGRNKFKVYTSGMAI
ncbi:MAG: diguanylate cyclase [Leptospiraceae bacterium]|nr:diguanylate cyclase [Leptospiraceae bacterium]